jgi:geranylgeranyl transferase type-2 subunit alpha
MATFDPVLAPRSFAPDCPNSERLQYIYREKETILDMLDGFEDCKWIYHALIHCTLIAAKIEGSVSREGRAEVLGWLAELRKLDPLREGRWADFEKSL